MPQKTGYSDSHQSYFPRPAKPLGHLAVVGLTGRSVLASGGLAVMDGAGAAAVDGLVTCCPVVDGRNEDGSEENTREEPMVWAWVVGD